jgi:sulfhydrogenase subunit alpha
VTRTIRVEHLARVEGHGGITVELAGDRVVRAHFDVFEGMRLIEGLLRGRHWSDVAPVVSRICSICSAAHALTSIKATETAFGLTPTPQTRRLRELLFRGESIESHALHLFLLAAPDYLGYAGAAAMAADHPSTVALGLRLKKLGNAILETIGGRAVHPVNAVVGGFGRLPTGAELVQLDRALRAGLQDLDAAIDVFAALPAADICHDPTTYAALRPPLGYGYYDGDEVVFRNGRSRSVRADRFRDAAAEFTVEHSNARHSRFGGEPFMVGALARLSVNADRLGERAAAAMERLGLRLPSADPMDNNRAQVVELVHDVETAAALVERMLADGLAPEPPIPVEPRAGTGTVLTEAPRGLLLHSYTYDVQGLVVAADVITPTALNAASLEARFGRAVEQSLHRDDATLTHRLEMIARAYDPCISCSVHLVRR